MNSSSGCGHKWGADTHQCGAKKANHKGKHVCKWCETKRSVGIDGEQKA